ncbi:MAG: hypothetical protein HYV54_02780 [Parcubacteria group bacterium]|nr:hypothetical protein [Parcubacteria group bacterium]
MFKKRGGFYRLGINQQKIILLLSAGIGLGFTRTPSQQYRLIKGISKEWKKINYFALKRSIAGLYRSKLISKKKNNDGSVTMVLTSQGKKKALVFNLRNMRIKEPKAWDKKWRLVLFDIPEKRRMDRGMLRSILKKLGFYEFQKSVLVLPYECQDELDYVIELFNLRPHVRIATATHLDNESHLKDIFRLS